MTGVEARLLDDSLHKALYGRGKALYQSTHHYKDFGLLGDQPAYRSESALTELWLKCDDPAVLEEARQIIVRYAAVRQYDEALTYGIKWRTTINQ